MSGRGVGKVVNVIFGRRVKRNKRMEKIMMDERAAVEGACKVGRKMHWIYVQVMY